MYIHNGQQLRQLLAARKIRPSDFARRISMSRQWLHEAMKTVCWRDPTLTRIATALKVSPTRFFEPLR